MRSFLHHRIYAQGATKNVLFFGCRKQAMDYHYREEWEQLEREGTLRVFTACSRDQVKYIKAKPSLVMHFHSPFGSHRNVLSWTE